MVVADDAVDATGFDRFESVVWIRLDPDRENFVEGSELVRHEVGKGGVVIDEQYSRMAGHVK